jgi:hypothetical protein
MFSLPSQSLQNLLQVIIFLFLLLAYCGTANACAWDWESNATLSSVFKTNPTLRADEIDTEDLFGMLAAYEMGFKRKSGNSYFKFNPRVTRNYYPDRKFSALESTDFFLRGSSGYSFRTSNLSIAFSAAKQNILSNDNSVAQSGDQLNAFQADDTVYTYRLSPNFIWKITHRDQLLIGFSGSIKDFDKDYSGRSDVDSYSFNSTYTHAVTRRQSFGFTGIAYTSSAEGINCFINFNAANNTDPPITEPCSDFDNPLFVNGNNKNDTDGYSASLDYSYSWSDTAKVKVRYGLQKSESTQTIRDLNGNTILIDEDLNEVEKYESDFESTTYNIIFDKRLQNSEYRISLGRSVVPSQEGTPQDRFQLNFNGETKLSQRMTARLKVNGYLQESIFLASDDNPTDFERETRYIQGQFALSWSATSKWNISTTYTYSRRHREKGIAVPSTTASGNTLSVALSYSFKKMR